VRTAAAAAMGRAGAGFCRCCRGGAVADEGKEKKGRKKRKGKENEMLGGDG